MTDVEIILFHDTLNKIPHNLIFYQYIRHFMELSYLSKLKMKIEHRYS